MRLAVLLFVTSKLCLALGPNCAKAKLLSGTNCSDAQVEFDLTDCIEPQEHANVKTTCKGDEAVAVLTTKTATYQAVFKNEVY